MVPPSVRPADRLEGAGRHRRSDDACVVAQLGCNDLGVDVDGAEELLVLATDATADDHEIGSEQPLYVIKVLAQTTTPFAPAEIFFLPYSAGDLFLL